MGIALHILSTPFQAPFRTLCHGLRQFALLQAPRQPQPPAPPLGAPAAHQPPPGLSGRQRPPRGNWPFTVRPPAPVAKARPAAKPTKVLRQPGTGRLIIAGRMADVCAELDRLAASEAMQA